MVPSDFYFAIDKKTSKETGVTTVIVTERDLWDKEGYWSDTGEEESLMPDSFFKLTDALYEYEGSIQEARVALSSLGFIENNSIII